MNDSACDGERRPEIAGDVGGVSPSRGYGLSPLSTKGCVAQRLRIVRLSPTGISVDMNQQGVVCVGVGAYDGVPPLVVLAEEPQAGCEATAISAARDLLPFLQRLWQGLFGVVGATVVARNSSGWWDLVQVSWTQQELVRRADVLPLRWIECDERSEEAFLGVFGAQAQRALYVLFRMRVLNLPQLKT